MDWEPQHLGTSVPLQTYLGPRTLPSDTLLQPWFAPSSYLFYLHLVSKPETLKQPGLLNTVFAIWHPFVVTHGLLKQKISHRKMKDCKFSHPTLLILIFHMIWIVWGRVRTTSSGLNSEVPSSVMATLATKGLRLQGWEGCLDKALECCCQPEYRQWRTEWACITCIGW